MIAILHGCIAAGVFGRAIGGRRPRNHGSAKNVRIAVLLRIATYPVER